MSLPILQKCKEIIKKDTHELHAKKKVTQIKQTNTQDDADYQTCQRNKHKQGEGTVDRVKQGKKNFSTTEAEAGVSL